MNNWIKIESEIFICISNEHQFTIDNQWTTSYFSFDVKSNVNYLPKFPYPKITIRNLLSHRSGIPNYVHFVESMGWDSNKNLNNNDLLTLMINNKDKIRVGKNDSYFEYSKFILLWQDCGHGRGDLF